MKIHNICSIADFSCNFNTDLPLPLPSPRPAGPGEGAGGGPAAFAASNCACFLQIDIIGLIVIVRNDNVIRHTSKHYLLLKLLDELLFQRLLLLRRLDLLQQSVVLRLRLRRLLLLLLKLLLQLFVRGRTRWRAVRGLRTLYRITYELVSLSNFVMRIQATTI